MASKYAAVTPNLPRLDNTEPGQKDKVEVLKTALVSEFTTSADLANEYVTVRSVEDDLNEQLDEVRLRRTAVESLLIAKMDEDGLDAMRLACGFNIFVQVAPYAQVVDREACRKWCIAQGMENQMTLPWSTLNSLNSERLLAGEPEPDGVQTFAKTTLMRRKA